jgi:hypothetical protein
MIRVTREDFESFKRHKDPEVFTQAQINTWVSSLQDLLVKAESDELNDIEKSDVEKFNEEFNSFMQIEVVGNSRDLLTKSLEYERFFVREKQVEFDTIEKGEDGIEKSRHGKYMDTALNRKMGRVGAEFGSKKEGDDILEKGGEGSRGGKVIGHTKSGKPIYDTFSHPEHANFSKEDHRDAQYLHEGNIKSKEKEYYSNTKKNKEKMDEANEIRHNYISHQDAANKMEKN